MPIATITKVSTIAKYKIYEDLLVFSLFSELFKESDFLKSTLKENKLHREFLSEKLRETIRENMSENILEKLRETLRKNINNPFPHNFYFGLLAVRKKLKNNSFI
ncbi:hypothetical protein [Gardnerella vaginalis]|uniref:hypothetical protein n=1 Tax=Gardnerella vaginalis TaxID=2702 RepID=UPI0039F03FF3